MATEQNIRSKVQRKNITGPNNPNWKGSNALPQSGRARAERWFKKEPCESCGKLIINIERHHKDGNTNNNERSNIKFLCRKCHMIEDGRLEKFIKLKRNRDECGRYSRSCA